VLNRSATQLAAGARDKYLADKLESLAATLNDDVDDAITNRRRADLAATLSGIAARLR